MEKVVIDSVDKLEKLSGAKVVALFSCFQDSSISFTITSSLVSVNAVHSILNVI